jgi:hypothetical protein
MPAQPVDALDSDRWPRADAQQLMEGGCACSTSTGAFAVHRRRQRIRDTRSRFAQHIKLPGALLPERALAMVRSMGWYAVASGLRFALFGIDEIGVEIGSIRDRRQRLPLDHLGGMIERDTAQLLEP